MKESKYIIRKIIIGVGIALCLMFIRSCNVNAAVNNTSFKLNDETITNNNFITVPEGNQAFNVNYQGYPEGLSSPTNPWFVSVVLCIDYATTSIYNFNNTAATDYKVNITNYSCYYPNSSYTGGKVVILNYKNAGGGSYNNTTFTWYLDGSSVTIIDFKISLDSYVNPQDYSNITNIINQQQIINQNDTIINNSNTTNNKLDDLNKNLTDETLPNLNGLENSAGWLPAGPVDSIINLPLTLLNNLQTNLGNTCKPVTVTLPFVHKDITLPCITSIYKQIEGLDTWFQGVGVIAAAVILYKYFIYLYKRVDDILTLRENTMEGYFEDSLWGGM